MRRLLPEAAYDFWAYDGRDGERGPTRDTIAAAKVDMRRLRGLLPSYERCVITVEWKLNERKLLTLLTLLTEARKPTAPPGTRTPGSTG